MFSSYFVGADNEQARKRYRYQISVSDNRMAAGEPSWKRRKAIMCVNWRKYCEYTGKDSKQERNRNIMAKYEQHLLANIESSFNFSPTSACSQSHYLISRSKIIFDFECSRMKMVMKMKLFFASRAETGCLFL